MDFRQSRSSAFDGEIRHVLAVAEAVTLQKAAAVLSKLERKTVTPAQVRSILVVGTDGRALEPRQHGDTRPYTAVDLALIRLTLRLWREGISRVVARVMVAGLSDRLVDVWRKDAPMALYVVGLRGLLLWRGARIEGAAAVLDLPAVWRGIPEEVRATRAADPAVWQWNRPVSRRTLVRAQATELASQG